MNKQQLIDQIIIQKNKEEIAKKANNQENLKQINLTLSKFYSELRAIDEVSANKLIELSFKEAFELQTQSIKHDITVSQWLDYKEEITIYTPKRIHSSLMSVLEKSNQKIKLIINYKEMNQIIEIESYLFQKVAYDGLGRRIIINHFAEGYFARDEIIDIKQLPSSNEFLYEVHLIVRSKKVGFHTADITHVPELKADSIDNVEFTRYQYFLGIDSVKMQNIHMNENYCFISPTINLGSIKEGEYINLNVEHDVQPCNSIEYYIIDELNRTASILPINNTEVKNEKIFYNLDLRFPTKANTPITIKENNKIIDISLNKAKQIRDKNYTVDYIPINNANKYMLTTSKIKIKVIFRNYDINESTPTLSRIEIKKYKGD